MGRWRRRRRSRRRARAGGSRPCGSRRGSPWRARLSPARALVSAVVSVPATAMTSDAVRCAPWDARTAAKRSSPSGSMVARRSITAQPSRPRAVVSGPPSLVATSMRRRMRVSRSTTDAVASTATSNEAPRWASVRVSSMTTARARHCASSWRTMSSSRRALDRQCTRRRSSPTSYSRRVRNSSPSAACARRCTVSTEATTRPPACRGARMSWTRGQIVDLARARQRPGAAGEAERVGDRERDRAER